MGYIYVCIYIYIYIFIYTYMNTYMCVCVCVCVCNIPTESCPIHSARLLLHHAALREAHRPRPRSQMRPALLWARAVHRFLHSMRPLSYLPVCVEREREREREREMNKHMRHLSQLLVCVEREREESERRARARERESRHSTQRHATQTAPADGGG